MVACKQCTSPNSVDSLFCKKCGATIATEVRSEAQQKLQELVSEGYRIFNEGRTDEARLIAETVLAEEPMSTSALSLKGMCHERVGELALALEAYEKVVELNPDSALDKIKVTHLRQAIAGKILVEPPPRKGRALVGAIAAGVMVIAIGAAFAAFGNQKDAVAKAGEVETPANPNTSAFNPTNLANQNPVKPEQQSNPGPGNQTQTAPPSVTLPSAENNRRTTTIPPWGRGDTQLPSVESGISGEIGRPVNPNITIRPETPPPTSNPGEIDPMIGNSGRANGNAGGGTSVEDEPPPKSIERPSVIDIKLSAPRVSNGGSSEPGENVNGVQALLAAANQQFLLGKFAQAANTYEAALRSGASPGTTNQRIAQCYANLNRNGDAANAYRRAIGAFESSLRSGSGDKGRLQSAIDSCKQALKLVGG